MRKILKASLVVLPGAVMFYWLILLVSKPGNSLKSQLMKFTNESEAYRSLQTVYFRGKWEAETRDKVLAS